MVSSVKKDDLRLPSGRTIGQFRKEAKSIKKKQQIPLSKALDFTIKEYGLSEGWKTLMQHAKWMVAGEKDVPPILPHGNNTLMLGTTPGFSRIGYMLWEDTLKERPDVCDVVIDCSGNPLTYAYMQAHLKEHHDGRLLRVLDLMSDSVEGHQFAMDADTMTLVTHAVTRGKDIPYEDSIGALQGGAHDLPESVAETFRESRDWGLMRLLDLDGGVGYPSRYLFEPGSSLLFSLSNSMKCAGEYNQLLVQVLNMILEESRRHPHKPFNVTIITPNERMFGASEIIDAIYDNQQIKTNIVAMYPINNGDTISWLSPLVKKADVFAGLKPQHLQEVPNDLQCLSTLLMELDGVNERYVECALFRYGEIIDTKHYFKLRSIVKPIPVKIDKGFADSV